MDDLNLNKIRKDYPKYKDWSDDRLRSAIEKKNAAKANKSKGFAGVGEDVEQSLESLPQAAGEMIGSIPGGASNVAKYAGEKPGIETLANLGAGGVESGAGLLSAPQMLARYLADKFPAVKNMPGLQGINDPTLYEGLMNFEKQHGLASQSEQEGSVRNLGGLMFGGKGLSMLPNLISRALALSAESAGRGGDPVHAAILSVIGEKAVKGLGKGIDKAADMNKPIDIYGSPPPPPPGAGGAPSASMTSPMPAPMNAGFPVPPKTPPKAPPPITANIGAAPSGSPYMQTIGNIPQAALNIGKAIPRAVAKIPEALMQGTASMLESGADALTSRIDVPGVQPLVGGLASYLKHISVPPEEMAKRKLFSDIEHEDIPKMIERDEAGKRLKLTYLTPSELMDSPFESVKQGDIGRTTQGMKMLYKEGKVREGSEEAAINTLFDLIHTSKLDPIKKAAYDATMAETLPQDFIDRQSKRPVIQDALKKIKNNTAYRQMLQEEYGVDIDKVPANSFMLWDMVKRVLGDMEYKSAKDKPTEASVFGNTRRSMVKAMDAIAPDYKTARSISERKFTKEKLEKVFDKKDKTFNNFDSFLKSDENYNEIVQKLQAFPDALQQLRDIKLFSGKMVPNNPSTRAAAALKRTGMSDARNPLEAKKRALDEAYGQEHDVAAVKLMTNPDFMKEFAAHLLKGGK